jgi:tripartite-type tricarboxylate transporter receptor subunit TctC
MIKLFAAAALSLATTLAAADSFPSRPITLVVPFSAGGPTDVVARQLAMAMEKDLGQTIVVENKPSTGGIVGSEAVVRSAPNGYTLLIFNMGMSTLPALSSGLRFDPTKDFSYIGEVVDVPMTLIGRKDFEPQSFKELVSYLRTHQESVNLSNAGVGTASHLCGMLLMKQLDLALTTIPYKGAAPAMMDLQGGQVDLLCDQISTTLQPILAQRVKPYGATTKNRLDELPGLPTLNEQGLDNFEVTVWHGIYAAKDTPKPIIDRLVKALQAGLNDPAFRSGMAKLGAVPVDKARATPEGLSSRLTDQIATWTPLIEQSKSYLK